MEKFQYYNPQSLLNNSEEKLESFKAKLKSFDNIETVSEAKKLAKELFYIQNEISYIKAGDALCTIISRKNLLRIVIKNKKEITCYNFTREEI